MSAGARKGRTIRAGFAALACAVALGAGPAARAQQGPDGAKQKPAAQAGSYRQHMDNGVKLYQDRNYQAAIVEFEAAYRAQPKANPLVNISLCHKERFEYPRAIASLELALARHPDTMTEADKKAAADAIAEMRSLLGYVTLDLAPANASVTVDGAALPAGAEKQPIALGPGPHRIGASAPGFATGSENVTIASGQKDVKVILRLTPNQGWLTVRADDGKTAIAIDQKAVGYGSWAGFLDPGTHVVQWYQPGGQSSYAVEVDVAAGKSQDIRPGVGGRPISGTAPKALPDVPPKPVPVVPPPPPLRGIYGMVTAGLMAPLAHPGNFLHPESESGGAFGARVGYRLNNAASFEGMFEYSNINVASETSPGADYTLASYHIGLNLRLHTPARRVRFVGILGGGLVHDSLKFDEPEATGFARVPGCRPDNECKDTSGFDPYLLSELGIELEFGGVLVGLAFVSSFQAMKGLYEEAYGNNPIVLAGGGVRIGYGTW
ncbi:MAG: hypothetical protein WKG00_09050 [Polyangiaceae bacterium]